MEKTKFFLDGGNFLQNHKIDFCGDFEVRRVFLAEAPGRKETKEEQCETKAEVVAEIQNRLLALKGEKERLGQSESQLSALKFSESKESQMNTDMQKKEQEKKQKTEQEIDAIRTTGEFGDMPLEQLFGSVEKFKDSLSATILLDFEKIRPGSLKELFMDTSGNINFGANKNAENFIGLGHFYNPVEVHYIQVWDAQDGKMKFGIAQECDRSRGKVPGYKTIEGEYIEIKSHYRVVDTGKSVAEIEKWAENAEAEGENLPKVDEKYLNGGRDAMFDSSIDSIRSINHEVQTKFGEMKAEELKSISGIQLANILAALPDPDTDGNSAIQQISEKFASETVNPNFDLIKADLKEHINDQFDAYSADQKNLILNTLLGVANYNKDKQWKMDEKGKAGIFQLSVSDYGNYGGNPFNEGESAKMAVEKFARFFEGNAQQDTQNFGSSVSKAIGMFPEDEPFTLAEKADANGEFTVQTKENTGFAKEVDKQKWREKAEWDESVGVTSADIKLIQNKVPAEYVSGIPAMNPHVLKTMRTLIDRFPKIRFSSTIRTQEKNDSLRARGIKASTNSDHMYGLAFDISDSPYNFKNNPQMRNEVKKFLQGYNKNLWVDYHNVGGGAHFHVSYRPEGLSAPASVRHKDHPRFTEKNLRERANSAMQTYKDSSSKQENPSDNIHKTHDCETHASKDKFETTQKIEWKESVPEGVRNLANRALQNFEKTSNGKEYSQKNILVAQGQNLYVLNVKTGELEGEKPYSISTARNGYGNAEGSNKTPTGTLKIGQKNGANANRDTIFRGGNPTNEKAKIYTDSTNVMKDEITARVMTLEGLEGKNSNSEARKIYIHGTQEEGLIGTPQSHGCIRMKNDEVIQLFNTVEQGTLLEIAP